MCYINHREKNQFIESPYIIGGCVHSPTIAGEETKPLVAQSKKLTASEYEEPIMQGHPDGLENLQYEFPLKGNDNRTRCHSGERCFA